MPASAPIASLVPPPAQRETLCLSILRRLHAYWQTREMAGANDSPFFYLDNPRSFSARFLADVMLGYLVIALWDRDSSAMKMVHVLFAAILERQGEDGSFRWNLPDPHATRSDGVRDQVDLGMVLDAMDLLARTQILTARERVAAGALVSKAVAYLLTVEWPQYPGIMRKRHYDHGPQPPIDVLNAEALAAKALAVAMTFNNAPEYRSAAMRFLTHLQSRFGSHYAGWWPYSESLPDRRVLPADRDGRSVFFQAMMVIHLADITRQPPFREFQPMVTAAAAAIVQCTRDDGRTAAAFESRPECIGKPNALVADSLLRLNTPTATAIAIHRLKYISTHLITDNGDVRDEQGNGVSDIWRVWLFSDVARITLRTDLPGCPGHALDMMVGNPTFKV